MGLLLAFWRCCLLREASRESAPSPSPSLSLSLSSGGGGEEEEGGGGVGDPRLLLDRSLESLGSLG